MAGSRRGCPGAGRRSGSGPAGRSPGDRSGCRWRGDSKARSRIWRPGRAGWRWRRAPGAPCGCRAGAGCGRARAGRRGGAARRLGRREPVATGSSASAVSRSKASWLSRSGEIRFSSRIDWRRSRWCSWPYCWAARIWSAVTSPRLIRTETRTSSSGVRRRGPAGSGTCRRPVVRGRDADDEGGGWERGFHVRDLLGVDQAPSPGPETPRAFAARSIDVWVVKGLRRCRAWREPSVLFRKPRPMPRRSRCERRFSGRRPAKRRAADAGEPGWSPRRRPMSQSCSCSGVRTGRYQPINSSISRSRASSSFSGVS